MSMMFIGNSGKVPSQPSNILGGWTNMGKSTPKPASQPHGMSNTLNNAAAQPSAAAPEIDPLDLYAQTNANINAQYSYLTGGPNWGLINSLIKQRKEAQQRYKTNRADVENMYGQLTTDVQADTTALGQSYDTAVTQSNQRAGASVTGLSNELAAQEQRRNAVAQSLGIGKEAALTDFGSTGRINEAMGTILGQSQNWQGFLESQKGTALQQGANMATGVENTKNQTTTAMKQEYDRVAGQYNAAIANEKSKQAVRKLTAEGSMLMSLNNQRLKKALTTQFGLDSASANGIVKKRESIYDAYDSFGKDASFQSPSSFNGVAPGATKAEYSKGKEGWYAMMMDQYTNYVVKSKNADAESINMPSYLLDWAKSVGVSPGDVVPSYSNVQ